MYNRGIMTKAKQKRTIANGTTIEKIGNATIASSPNGHTAVWNDTSNLMNGVADELSQTANSPITMKQLQSILETSTPQGASPHTWYVPTPYSPPHCSIEEIRPEHEVLGELKVRMLDLLTRAMPTSECFDEGEITISKESIMIVLNRSWTIHAMFDGENYDLEEGTLNVFLDEIGPDTRFLTIEEVIEECESILDEYENKLNEDKKNGAAK